MDHQHHDMQHMQHDVHNGGHGGHHMMMDSDGATTTPDHSNHGGGDGGHMMSMFFHFGYSEVVLFESWAIGSAGGLLGSMVGIFFMAALYEGLKYYREFLFWRTYNALQYRAVSLPQQQKTVVAEDNQVVQPTMLSLMHGYQTFLHMVQMVLSYFLMLIFMTYNVWLCVAVVLGAATGYFLFGWKKSVIVDVTEHCH